MGWGKAGPLARLAAVVAAAAVMSGCWLQIGGGPEHANFAADENTLTTANVGGLGRLWQSAEAVTTSSEVVTSAGRGYVSDRLRFRDTFGARVVALDLATGATAWSQRIGGEGIELDVSPVVVVGDEVWVSYNARDIDGCRAELLALDAATGAIRRTVFAGRTSAVVPFTGKVAWTGYEQPTQNCLTAPPRLYVADAATGNPLWTAPVHGMPFPTVVGSRVIVDGRAYDATGCGAFVCEAVWEATIGSPIRAVFGSTDGHIFATSETGRIVALDPATGATLWSASLPPDAVANPIGGAVAGGRLYVVLAGSATTLAVYDAGGCGAATCAPVWSALQFAIAHSGPVVAGGVVYVPEDNFLTAYRADGCGQPTCTPTVVVPSSADGPLSVSDGRVLMPTGGSTGSTGVVLAFGAA